MEEAIVALLNGNAAVAALIATRVFPSEAPANSLRPFVAYVRNDGANLNSLGGRGGLNKATYDLRCVAETQAEAKAVGDAVEVACDVLNQTLGGIAVNAIDVMDVRDELIQGKDMTSNPSWARVVSISGFWRTN